MSQPRPGNARTRVYWGLSILLAVVLLYCALRGVDWRGVRGILANARWRYLAAGATIASCSFFLRAVRWRILLNAQARLGVIHVFWANMAGYLGNSFLPARAGEVIRSYLISRDSPVSKAYVLTTALAERLADVIALVLWSSLILLGMHSQPAWMAGVARTMAMVAGAGALGLAVLPHTGGFFRVILGRFPKLLQLLDQVLLGMAAFHNWSRFLGFACLTVVIWVADAFSTMMGAAALNLHVSFPVAMLLITGLGLGSALPSTPGSIGIYQFVGVSILTLFGISRDGALAYTLMAQATSSIVVLLYGLPGLYRLGWRRTNFSHLKMAA